MPFILGLTTACGGQDVEEVGAASQANVYSLYGWLPIGTLTPRLYANPFIVTNWGRAVDTNGVRIVVASSHPDVDVFRRQTLRTGSTGYVREATFRAAQSAPNGQFGYDVATDGDRIAIGAAGGENGGYAGYVDIYRRSGTTWTFEQRVVPQGHPSTYQSTQFAFGRAVDIDGDTLVVGADRFDAARGAAFVYRRINGTWTNEAFLQGTVSYTDSYFGKDVSVSGDRVLIGHSGAGHFSDFQAHVLVYRRDGEAWNLEADITSGLPGPDLFGASLSLWGDRFTAVSISDVRVYERTGSAWSLLFSAPRTGDSQTRSLAYDGERIAVRSGSDVLIFRDSGTTFSLEETEPDPSPAQNDPYGVTVGLSWPILLIGKQTSNRVWAYERRKMAITPIFVR